jgi:hypothetical protein
MTPTALVWTFFFVHIGVILVATAYYTFSAALAPRVTHRARVRFAQRPWLPILIGLGASLPWVIAGLVLMNAPLAPVKFAGVVVSLLWVLLGLVGGAGLAQHIGAPHAHITNQPAWTDSVRGGLFITLTWILPLVGWFLMLPLTLATGVGCLILAMFPVNPPVQTAPVAG